jgi:hypothetical protein
VRGSEGGQAAAKVKLAQLEYVDITVKGFPQTVTALVDSGSQLNVIDASIIEPMGLVPIGTVLIRGIVGQPVRANLVKLQMQLQNESCIHDEFITVICAACENLNETLIVTLPVADQLNSIVQYCNDSVPYEIDGLVAVTTRSQLKTKCVASNSDVAQSVSTIDSSSVNKVNRLC